MMKKIKWKGGALMCPVPPAMVTCGDVKAPNIITVAWTGILATHPPKTYISVRPTRYSYDLIKKSGEFIINLTSEELIHSADYCGMMTGRKVDKFAACSLTPECVDGFSCPMIAEAPLSILCRVSDIMPMGSHDMFIADIISVYINEDLLDNSGKLHIEKARLSAFAHGEYFGLGHKLGSFGFSVAKKKKIRK